MKFKKNVEPFASTESVWYSLTDGGYLKPENLLEKEDAKKVNDAIALVQQFIQEAEDNGLIEEM